MPTGRDLHHPSSRSALVPGGLEQFGGLRDSVTRRRVIEESESLHVLNASHNPACRELVDASKWDKATWQTGGVRALIIRKYTITLILSAHSPL
jgi:hypothetical protein